MSTTDALKVFIIEQFAPDASVGDLPDDYDLLDNGVIDSLNLLRLIAWVGERLGTSLDDVDIAPDDFRSVSAIQRFIDTFGTAARFAELPRSAS
jgi:acyl carrier protein